jgi:nitroreductase
MISFIKRYLPTTIKNSISKSLTIVKLASNYYYDFKQYSLHSATLNEIGKKKIESRIIETYHVLEKGLAMRDVRAGFGEDKCRLLLGFLSEYLKLYRSQAEQIVVAFKVLEKYFQHNKINGIDQEKLFLEYSHLKTAFGIFNNVEFGGVRYIAKEEILLGTCSPFDEFSSSRHSIREYVDRPIDIETIRKAIRIAQSTPSVCNRQSARVFVIRERQLVELALSYQNGNRGFGHLANTLLIVASDLECFKGVNERNQAYIDAGMFAMSLLYSLHYCKLGACPLNWSVLKDRDSSLKEKLKIDGNYSIAMMISVGHIPDSFKVTASHRSSLDSIMAELV